MCLRMLYNAVDKLVHFGRLNLWSLLCLGMGGSITKPSHFYTKC